MKKYIKVLVYFFITALTLFVMLAVANAFHIFSGKQPTNTSVLVFCIILLLWFGYNFTRKVVKMLRNRAS